MIRGSMEKRWPLATKVSVVACVVEHRIVLGLVLLYVALSQIAAAGAGQTVNPFIYSGMFLPLILTYIGGFILIRTMYIMIAIRPAALFGALREDLARLISLDVVVGGLLLTGVFFVDFSIFQSMKHMIPDLQPFAFDEQFAALDKAVHFGRYPHELLQPLTRFPVVTFGINFAYNIWMFVMFGFLSWQIFDRSDPQSRMQFLIAFVLAWGLIGTLAATLLSSAGPVYFDQVTGLAGPYGDLMGGLEAANEYYPIWALRAQDYLWQLYEAREAGVGAGISAMPSMHVAIAVLLYLIARRRNLWAGRAAGAFALIIMVGSVHLGWHYAIDGYVGALMMVVIWKASAPMARLSQAGLHGARAGLQARA